MSDDATHPPSQGGNDRDERFEACLGLAAQMHSLAGLYQGVVHDLKSPLNALVVNLELLRATLDPEAAAADKQQRYARILHEELLRLNRSIETLLPAAALSGGPQEQLDLRPLVDEVSAFIAPQARQQRVTVTPPTADRADGRPVPVYGVRSRLKQALLAIAVNALEAMPDGGTLEVGLGVVPGTGGAEGLARVSVEDTGPGIPEPMRDRLYELYTTTKDGHQGIGLYVAHQVVKSTNGSIRVSSKADRGTRFDIDLPLVARNSRGAAN